MYGTAGMLSVVQGDKLNLDIKLELNNQKYDLSTGEKIWFDVFKKACDQHNVPETIIHIEQESNRIRIPCITLDPGDYMFDVGIIFADGTTKTILPCLKNQHNILRVLGKSCPNKHKITGTIFEDAFNAQLDDAGCSCNDIPKIYNLIDELKELYKHTFIVVDTILERDSIPKNRLVNGKVVKVVDNGEGKTQYFSYKADTDEWIEEIFTNNNKPDEPDPEPPEDYTIDDIKDLDNTITWAEIGAQVEPSTGSINIDDIKGLSSIVCWREIGFSNDYNGSIDIDKIKELDNIIVWKDI